MHLPTSPAVKNDSKDATQAPLFPVEHILPFVLVTAEAEKDQIVEALKSGVSAYIIKPFSPETLKTKLEEAHQKYIAAAKAG